MCFFPIRFPSYGILHYMGNAWCFVSISHSIGRSSKIHPVVKIWVKDTHIFPKAWLLFFLLPSYSHPMVFYSTSKIHGFSRQFLIAWANAVKFVPWYDLVHWNLCCIRFPLYEPYMGFPTNFSCYG